MRSFFEALLGRGRRDRAETSYPPGHVPPLPMPAPAAHVPGRWSPPLPIGSAPSQHSVLDGMYLGAMRIGVPARVIAYLWQQSVGTEVTTDVLATAAGFKAKDATAFLQSAVVAQAISRRSSCEHDSRAPTLWSLGPKAPTVDQIAALTAKQPPARVVLAPPRPKAPARSIFEIRPEERRAAMEASVPAPGSFMAEWRRKRGEAA